MESVSKEDWLCRSEFTLSLASFPGFLFLAHHRVIFKVLGAVILGPWMGHVLFIWLLVAGQVLIRLPFSTGL